MPTVDDKVVAMSFESGKFESGVDRTISALNKLKEALKFPTAGKGLDDINAAGQKVDLSHIGRAIDGIKSKFSAMSVAALAVLSNIAIKAVDAGAKLVKSITLDPIIQGFHEYETQLNAVQTILSNTRAAGTKLKDVNNVLNELNRYADKTIYNFSEMTKNIGTFTAAGVDLKTSAQSIKGIANLAALSGSNSQQASTAMYQLSQAISSGRVTLQDWNSVVNAGMGGTVFQRALAQTAEHMGTLSKGSVELTGKMKNVSIAGESFRNSISAKPGEESWLTGKVLTTTLKQLSGDLSDAQLKAQGYSAAQIKAIQDQAQAALDAATQVKTLSQLLDTTKEAVGSGWAQTWQIIFGDFGEAKTLFTGLSNSINGFVGASSDARNKVLGDWKALGGRTLLIDGIKNAFNALAAVVKPIKEAFRDIFPPTTGKQLYDLTARFKAFTESLMPSAETIDNLKRTFRGLFALLDIGKQVIGGIFTVFGKLFGVIGEGGGGFLNLTGSIGDFLVSVDEALKKGDKLHNFFAKLGDVLKVPIQLFGALSAALIGLFSQKASGGISDSITGMGQALSPLEKIIQSVGKAWDKFIQSLSGASDILAPMVQGIAEAFGSLGELIAGAIRSTDFTAVLQVLQTGLIGGIFLVLKKAFSGGLGASLGGGILESIGGSFKALEGSLVALQTNIKAKTLKEIAIAVALLAGSIVALSFIQADKLNQSLAAITIAFGQLIGAMALLDKIGSSMGFIKLPMIAAGMILLSTAILILTGAVRNLSGLDWEQLAKGLGGIGVLLVSISAASGPLSKNASGMISAGLGISAIAIAMKILASAIGDFGGLSWAQIGKGLASVAMSLGLMAGAARIFPSGMVQIGAGLIAVSLGLKLLGQAVATFGKMEWGTIGKGLGAIAAGLLIVAGAMQIMPSNMVVSAAGLILVSVALNIMAKAIESMGGMSIEQIAKGLGTLAASLTILAVALYAMSGTLAGAAALAIAAAGLALLAPALVALGQQSWGQIVKGMVALTAALVILGAAGLLLEPVIPAMLGFGAALVLVGAGFALAGAGIMMVGIGLAAIAVAGPTAVSILINALIDLVEAIPRVVVGLVRGLLTIVDQLAATAPKFVDALVKILNSLVDVIIQASPKLGQAFTALLQAAIKVIRDNFPSLVQLGFDLLLALLNGVNNNIGQVIQMAVKLVTTVLTTVAGQLGTITGMGARVLASFLNGIANTIGTVVNMGANIINKFLDAIGNLFGSVVRTGVAILTHIVSGIAGQLSRLISVGGDAIEKFIDGIQSKARSIISAAVSAASSFISHVSSEMVKLVAAGGDAILNLLRGITAYVNSHGDEFGREGGRLAAAIIRGMASGIAAGAGQVISALGGVVGSAVSAAKKKLHIHSPSRVFIEIGKQTMQGLAVGITNETSSVEKSMEDVADTIMVSLSALPSAMEGLIDLNPVITPVLDLTQVQQGAQALSPMLAVPVTAGASYGQAASISAEQTAAQEEIAAVPGTTTVKFEQNNYSPEALTAIEIYRQTKNQLSQAKGALALA